MTSQDNGKFPWSTGLGLTLHYMEDMHETARECKRMHPNLVDLLGMFRNELNDLNDLNCLSELSAKPRQPPKPGTVKVFKYIHLSALSTVDTLGVT
jgi:hypothetical protein